MQLNTQYGGCRVGDGVCPRAAALFILCIITILLPHKDATASLERPIANLLEVTTLSITTFVV